MSITLVITPIYASILTLILIILSLRVAGFRMGFKLGFGHDDRDIMIRAIRTHGNFTEYIPFALLNMIILELQGFSNFVHVVGLLIIIGRILISIGISTNILIGKFSPFRQLGMMSTVTGLGFGCVGMFLGPNGVEDQFKFIVYFGVSLACSLLSLYVAYSEARAIKRIEKAKQAEVSK